MVWKVDRTMAIWGIAFGVMATLTGLFILRGIPAGFLAEGFFLIVMGWVLVLVAAAKLVDWISTRGRKGKEEEEKW